jgi:thiol-disulfide isomerase/thioredoxin
MHERYGENVRLVAINLNAEADKVKDYLKQKGFSFPIVQADENIVETAVRSYGLVALPTVFLIDENGIVRDCIVGDIDRQLTDERLSKIMPKNSSSS